MEELLVSYSQLVVCAEEMKRAMEIYRSAVDKAKAAAEDLGAKWEGSARDVFMAEQKNAYNYHTFVIQGVVSAYDSIMAACRRYADTEKRINELIHER